MKLYEREPACRFDDAHLLGNGRLAASVYGGVPFEEILINDDTLWSGDGQYRVNTEFHENLREARRLALQGRVKEAEDLIEEHMEGAWSEAYMPLGSALIGVGIKSDRRHRPAGRVLSPEGGDEAQDYRRELDLRRAVETVSYVRGGVSYRREYFVSREDQLIYARLTAEGGPLDLSLTLDSPLKHSVAVTAGGITLRGMAPDRAEPGYTPMRPALIYREEATSDALRFAAMARIIDTDGRIWADEDRCYVNGASFAVITVAAGTNYAGFAAPRDREVNAVAARLTRQLDRAKPWPEALRRHAADVGALYDRFDIDLGGGLTADLPSSARFALNADGAFDPAVGALAVQYARYLLIAGSRPGTQALNLQGIWNPYVQPPWSSNYTTNINLEMNYWPAEPFALSECHGPMLDLTRECAEGGRRAARDYYRLDGWVAHHNVDLWRTCAPTCGEAAWAFWPMAGVWMCQHLWTHYEYTGDEAFLRDTAYPVIREAARFMLDWLCEDGEGRLTTAPSTSPENRFIAPGGKTLRGMIADAAPGAPFRADPAAVCAVTTGSCMDLTLIRELFGNALRASEILGLGSDEFDGRLRDALKRLAPFRIGRSGTLQEWHEDYEESTPGMDHVSHLYGVYPGSVINERDYPAEYEAAYRSLQRRVAHGGMRIHWSGAWALALAARFHDRTLCTNLLASVTREFTANMLQKDILQIDAVFGYAAGIGEMLLQCHNGYIEFLPAPAYGWTEGSFHGMRARGGFECALVWKDGAPAGGRVISRRGGPCAVKAHGLRGVRRPGGETVPPGEDGIVRFDTGPGEAYELVF